MDQRKSASSLREIISSGRKELSAKVSDTTLENSRRYNYRRSPQDDLHKRQRMRIELHCLIELATISEFRDQRKQSYGVQSFQVIGSQRPPQFAMPRLIMIGNGLLGTSRSNHRY